ncbi:hypothetical protein PGB34_02170 [Xenophilus arseniciresistens]|uniref:Uncharacterized protein n=1 Tax=Xenophilus arseniciresistens TaxID=1283306 RepID=A0AAE3SYU4_9BURK|nr:hypothetical protein [Xenophilus arseniciresistens]MDA7415161.1 hypothetical protein [Xenophilus arseniciresistens]
MSSDFPPTGRQLVEVWGDTADTRHLAWAIVIGIGISLTGFLIANRILVSHVSSPELARAYAMLAGLAGCVASGVICAFIFQPKRHVVEGRIADQASREEVVAELAEAHGGLGDLHDLPPVVAQEMKELEIYELFARHEKKAAVADAGSSNDNNDNNNRKAAP